MAEYVVQIQGIPHTITASSVAEAERFGKDPVEVKAKEAPAPKNKGRAAGTKG